MRRSEERSFRPVMLVLGLVVAGLAACGGVSDDGRAKDDPGRAVLMESSRLPRSSISDWVSWGDHLVSVEVSSEAIGKPTVEEVERGDGLVGRTLTVRTNEVLWSRRGAPDLPAEFSFAGSGVIYDDGNLVTADVSGNLTLQVGRTYVFMVVKYPETWGPLGPVLPAPAPGRPIHLDKGQVFEEWAPAVDGITVEGLVALLARTAPDPLAAKHFDLEGVPRMAVYMAENPPGTAP